VGAGTGANLPHYPPSVERIVLLDPDAGMLARAAVRAGAFGERANTTLA
jgi:ubiquinone/menaquinone biosynthesis C-methylase UbiE